MLSAWGVVPVAGVTVSQLPPASVVAVAEKLRAALTGTLVTVTVWAAAEPPCGWVNFSSAVGTWIAPEVTESVTGMVMGLLATAAPPGFAAVMVMVPA